MKRCILLLTFLCMFLSCTSTPPELSFTIGNVAISPNDMAAAVATAVKAAEEIAQNTRDEKEAAINALQVKLAELGKKADKKQIGEREYDVQKQALLNAIERHNKELVLMQDNANHFGKNIQSVLMSGWGAVLDRYKAEQERQTRIAEVAVGHTLDNEAAFERLRFLSQPENLKTYLMFGTALCLGACGSYYGCKLAYNTAELLLEKQPDWIEESSYHTLWDSMLEYLPSFLHTPQTVPPFDHTLVFEPELATYLQDLATITQSTYAKGLPFQSILLYGPPGTGKTVYAKFLAHTLGIPYVIVKISKLQSFADGDDVEALDYLFTLAKKSPKGLIVFMDEIDILGKNRANLSERWQRILNLYLQHTGASSETVMVIGATNRFDILDEAFKNRFPHKIKVPLPGVTERERLLNLYIKKDIIDDVRTIKKDGKKVSVSLTLAPEIDEAFIRNIALQTEGFAGREIKQLTEKLRAQCYLTDDLILTKALFERELKRSMAQA